MEAKNIELLSEEVQDVISHIPSRLIRYGITIIFAIIGLLLLLSFYVKYPEVISAKITITAQNPPLVVVAKSTGKIKNIFIQDKQIVKAGDILAVIENTADLNDVLLLKQKLDSLKNKHSFVASSRTFQRRNDLVQTFQRRNDVVRTFQRRNDLVQTFQRRNDLETSTYLQWYSKQKLLLGDLQPVFETFAKYSNDYTLFLESDYQHKKITELQSQLESQKVYDNNLSRQIVIQTDDYRLSQKQFQRDSILYIQKVNAESDFEKSKKTYLQSKLTIENARNAKTSSAIQLSVLNQNILDLQSQFTERQNTYLLNINESLNNLLSRIDSWEQQFVLKTSIDGIVSFSKIWSVNQNVQTNDVVFTVVSAQNPLARVCNACQKLTMLHVANARQLGIVGKIQLPLASSGKVAVGQKVNIKLDNFPYMEYGTISGSIKNISLVPTDNSYFVEVAMSDTLKTNYGRYLPTHEEMTGTADIITHNLSIFQRFINPVKYVVKN